MTTRCSLQNCLEGLVPFIGSAGSNPVLGTSYFVDQSRVFDVSLQDAWGLRLSSTGLFCSFAAFWTKLFALPGRIATRRVRARPEQCSHPSSRKVIRSRSLDFRPRTRPVFVPCIGWFAALVRIDVGMETQAATAVVGEISTGSAIDVTRRGRFEALAV